MRRKSIFSEKTRQKMQARQKLKEQVLQLRQQDYGNQEIAELMILDLNKINRITKQLKAEEKVQDQRGRTGLGKAKFDWRDLQDKGTKKFIALVNHGKTWQKIGNAFDLTKQRVSQIIQLMLKMHGPEVFKRQMRKAKAG